MRQTKFCFPLIILSAEDNYRGSWPTQVDPIYEDTIIHAQYDEAIPVPTLPTDPGEIMSGGEGEPIEAGVPAKDETISPQGTHVTGTQTVTHEYLTLNGKVARETIKTNNSLTAVLDFVYDESGKPFALKYFPLIILSLSDSDYPTVPIKFGYTGSWRRVITPIHANTTVYTVETFTQLPDYTVTFQADGATVKTMTVEDGYVLKDSDYPAVPSKTGYTGEWVKYTSAIHSNVTVQAKYTAVVAKYTVFFKADGFTVKAIQVDDGYILQDADYPEVPAKAGCNGAWEKYTAAIHSNVTINAVYAPTGARYTVTFKANGATLKTMTVEDGYVLKTSDYPTIPRRAGYTGSWPTTGAIHVNTTITAIYKPDSSIVIPTQPTSPGELMSGGIVFAIL